MGRKEDNATYYQKHREEQFVRVTSRKKKNQLLLKGYANMVKSKPCSDCGVEYPAYVMDFDHVGGTKDDDISTLIRRNVSIKRLMKEIDKCEVVCSNCHRVRTYKRSCDAAAA